MGAVNDRGVPVTSLMGWEITLEGGNDFPGIVCVKAGEPEVSLGVDFLKKVPADLETLQIFDGYARGNLGLDTDAINRLTDWIRSNLVLEYHQHKGGTVIKTASKSPVMEHISVWVKGGKTAEVVGLFQMLGWNLWPHRYGHWGTGGACFVYSPAGGAYVQLTEEIDQTPGSIGSASHFALAGDVDWMMKTIDGWAKRNGHNVASEVVGEGKLMVFLPAIFEGAIELVPCVHPDFQGLLES